MLAAPGGVGDWAELDPDTWALLEPPSQEEVDAWCLEAEAPVAQEDEEHVPTTPVASGDEAEEAPAEAGAEAPGEEAPADDRWEYATSYARPENPKWEKWFPPGWQGTAEQGAWFPEAEEAPQAPQAPPEPPPPPQCPYREFTPEWRQWMYDNWFLMPRTDEWYREMQSKLESAEFKAAFAKEQAELAKAQQRTTTSTTEQHAPAEGVPDLEHHDETLPEWVYRPQVEAPLREWLYYAKVVGNTLKWRSKMHPTYPKDCHFCRQSTYFGNALCVNALCLRDAAKAEDAQKPGGRADKHGQKRRRTGTQVKRELYWAKKKAGRKETRVHHVRADEQEQARAEAEEAQAYHLDRMAEFAAAAKRKQALQAQRDFDGDTPAAATVSGLPPGEGDEEDDSWGHWRSWHQHPRQNRTRRTPPWRPKTPGKERRPKTPPRPPQKKAPRLLMPRRPPPIPKPPAKTQAPTMWPTRPSAAEDSPLDEVRREVLRRGRPRPSAAEAEAEAEAVPRPRPSAAGTRPRPSSWAEAEDDGDAEDVPFDPQAQWNQYIRRRIEHAPAKQLSPVQHDVLVKFMEAQAQASRDMREAQAMRRQTGPGT